MRAKPNTLLAYLLGAIKNHNSDECLIWPFGKLKSGYGEIRFEGRTTRVHRLAFKIVNGRWPKPHGCHSCDTPACFNPRHIFEGTQRSNLQDAAHKGRTSRGVQRPTAALNSEHVLRIRAEYVRGSRQCGTDALAIKYRVDQSTIWDIVNRKTWRYI